MSNSSLETKMLRLYRRRIDVKTFDSSYTAIENAPDYEISELEVSKDIKINKLKGLLYGYYIGAYLSISKDSVRQLHSLYEINDIVSAILSNPERKANLSQQQELSKFINILNQYNPIYRELLRFENNEVDRVEMLLQLLRTFGIYIPITKTDDLLYSAITSVFGCFSVRTPLLSTTNSLSSVLKRLCGCFLISVICC